MRPDEILILLHRAPFRPFRIHMSDGTAYEVRHPEMAGILRGLVHVYLLEDPRLGFAGRRVALLSFVHIARVEVYFPPGVTPIV